MKRFRRSLAVVSTAVAIAAIGCRRDKPITKTDSTHPSAVTPAESTATRPASTWDSGAGSVLLVGTDSPSRALLVLPTEGDSATLAAIPRPASVTLIGRGGDVQTANIPTTADSLGCHIAPLTAAPPPHQWSVGFIGGVVTPIPVDSAASVSHADSIALVASLSRLASGMPNDSAGRFTGLPFVVQTLWRFSIPDGSVVLAGSLVRQINQEATPLQERTFVIGERRAADTTFTMAYGERSYGQEETVETRELLAALSIGDAKTPAIVLSRDFGDENAYSLLERGSDGQWRLRWTSRRRHC